MKNIVKVLSIAVIGATLASCTDKPEFTTSPFVSMYSTSVTINEKAGGTLYNIPVKVYHAKEAVSVAYTISGTAVNGTDYTLPDQSGVLNFPVGTDSLAIPVNVIGQPGTYTGDKTVRVSLASSTGAEINSRRNFTLTIKDLDHPLLDLFGAYTMKAAEIGSDWETVGYFSWTMNISAYEGDATRIWMDNLSAFSAAAYHSYTGDAPVWGKVSSDKKTITITLPQKTDGNLAAFGLDKLWAYGHEGLGGDYILDECTVTFKLQDDGRWITTDNFGFSHPEDVVDYPDLFYPYCVNYSSYSANAPTYFKKN